MTTISGLVPFLFLLLAAPAIAWRGRRRRDPVPITVAQLLLAAWLAALVALTLFPLPWRLDGTAPPVVSDPRGWPHPWASITPFETIGMSLQRGFGTAEGRVLIGNVLAFVPLGLLAPVLTRRWRSALRILLLGAAASLAVELAQLGWDLVVGLPWRSADVDDVIVNAVGTVVGYGVWRVTSAVLDRRTFSAV